MPDFRPAVLTKTTPPRGTFVRFTRSSEPDGAPERPVRLWVRPTPQACAGPEREHEPLVGQVVDGAPGGRVWVTVPDGRMRLVSRQAAEVLGDAETPVEQLPLDGVA